MRLTIIFITACCISLFSYASPCSRCKKEPDACTCFRTHSSLSPQGLSYTHHPSSFEAPSLDGSDSDDAPSDDSGSGRPPCQTTVAQNPSAIATGKINTISCADTGDKNLVVLNNDGTPATNEPLGLYGRCVNRKNKPEQPAFTGTGRSMQATSSSSSPSRQAGSESTQASDILGIIAELSDLHINTASEEYLSILAPLNTAFISFFNLFSDMSGTEQDDEDTLNTILLSVGYELNRMNVNNSQTLCSQIRPLLDTGNLIYLTSGNHHYIFVAEQNDRFFMVSHFFQSPSNQDYQNIIRRDSRQNLARIKLSKNNTLKLYTLKKTSSAGYQSM